MVKNDDQEFGLSAQAIDKIRSTFTHYPQIEKVVIYGSRAKGNYRTGSDIDLTIIGNELSTGELLKIENELDDLLLPYKIDLSLFHHIEEKELIDHINRVGKVFYSLK